MLQRTLIILSILFRASLGLTQQAEEMTDPEPEGGVERLAAIFDRINFSETEIKAMRRFPLILIFNINPFGEAKLVKVARFETYAVRDSLFSRNDSLPRFRPKTVAGIPQSSLYGLEYSYRKDFSPLPEKELWFFADAIRPMNKDVSQYEIGSRDMWHKLEVGSNIFYDGAGEYLHPGVGFGAEVGLSRQKVDHAWVIGFDNFFNQKRDELPLETERTQRKTVFTFVYHVGYAIASGRNRWTPSVNYITSNLVRREYGERSIDDDRWGLGVTYTRLFPVFKDDFDFKEDASLKKFYLTMSFRPSYYFSGSTVFGSGLMFNLSFGIAFQTFSLREYTLREEYYERF